MRLISKIRRWLDRRKQPRHIWAGENEFYLMHITGTMQ